MVNIIIWFLLLGIIVFGLITTIGRLISSKPVLKRMSGVCLLIILVVIVLRMFFISSYPDPRTSYAVDDELIREYNPEESFTLYSINQWIKIEDFGWVYFKEIEADDKNQLRLFYRRPGFIGDSIYEVDVSLRDSNGNEFVENGGDIHAAFLLSSGSLDFLGESTDIETGEAFMIKIAGREYKLY